MSQVDIHIGTVLEALPLAVAQNTIIVFTADHGDYAGAHGFTSDKMGACYKEIVKVPLIVVDPTSRFAGDIGIVRQHRVPRHIAYLNFQTSGYSTAKRRHGYTRMASAP
jgi:membrane-anchored protein YejM (alkaline phosphatase superfamily)